MRPPDRGELRRGDERRRGHPNEFVRRVPEERAECGVGADDLASVADADAFGGRFREHAEPLLALTERLLDLDLLGHVAKRSLDLVHLTRDRVDRAVTAPVDPQHLAVEPDEPEPPMADLVGVLEQRVAVREQMQVVGMDEPGHRHPGVVGGGMTEHAEDRGHIGHRPAAVHSHDRVARVFRELAVPGLALGQLGHILDRAHVGHDLSAVTHDWSQQSPRPSDETIATRRLVRQGKVGSRSRLLDPGEDFAAVFGRGRAHPPPPVARVG